MSANAKRVASELATLAQDVRVVSVEEKTTAPPEKPSYRAAVKKSLSGNTIVIGGTIGFQAELFLNGKPQPGDYLYAWQPRPDVTFAPDGNRSSTVTATFNVPGKHPVLVSILDPASNVTLAESERIEMEVVGPKVEIRMEGEPPARPGREAQLRAVCEPDVSADIVEFKWEIAKGNAKAGRTDEGGKVFHLTPRDTKPLDVTLSLLARNEEIGKATWQATPEASKVTISEPKPVARADSLNWTPGVGVTATRPPLEQGEQATVEATVEPEPDKDKVRYVWTVQPAEGLRIGLDTSRMPLIEANRAGTYTLTVAVGDNDKSKLGEASRTVTVVPQGEGRSGEKTLKKMEGAKKDKEQKERKDRADAVWKEAKGAYAAGDLGKAEEKCKESLGIEPTDERGTFTRSLEKANALWRDGETLEKAGRTEEALAKYKESIQPPLPTSSARQDHVRKLEKGSQPPSQPGPGVGQTKPGPESAASASGDRRIEVSRAVGVALTALPDGRRVEQVVRVYYKLSVTTGHRARLSVRGTDGFSQTVEGLSSVILDRAMPRGRVADTIVGEDADMPGCSATQTREYE
jgi:hypothetical protein